VSHHGSPGRLLGSVWAKEPKGSLVWLTVEVHGWRGARPGQFAMLQPEPSRCFLPRALSVADEIGERVSFLVAPVGEGTEELCALETGEPVWVLGPLGNGFDLDEIGAGLVTPATSPAAGLRLVVVAGGVGAAPFPLLLARLASGHRAADAGVSAGRRGVGARFGVAHGPWAEQGCLEVVVLLGFRDALQAQGAAPVEAAVSRSVDAGLQCRLLLATEDDRVVVCGPPAMSAAVWRTCSSIPDVRTWFSLEAGMACGVGSCHGCALTLADGSLARVCHDGPVFSGERVFGPGPVTSDGGPASSGCGGEQA
jgi:dihydroorotate dehydrogenase electron transfer subunit